MLQAIPHGLGLPASAKTWLTSERVFAFFAFLLFLGISGLAKANEPAASLGVLDLPAYVSELNRWGEALGQVKQNPVEAAALRRQLPPAWSVSVGGQRYQVPTEWLREELEAIEKNPKSAASCEAIQQRIHAMRAEALAIASSPAYSAAQAQKKLDAILKRSEFRRVHAPTWADELRERIILWIWRMLDRLLGGARVPPASSRILVWILIAAASIVLVVWMVRRLMARQATVTLSLESSQQAAKTRQQRAREAFAAAERGDFRQAIRLSYWAGVHRLEELGLWKTDRTRTHREYLHLLPSSHPQRDTFSDITLRFERVWYAGEESSAEDFALVMKNLERLGCEFHSKLATEHS